MEERQLAYFCVANSCLHVYSRAVCRGQVLIFGESGGGKQIANHITMPASNSFFQVAVTERYAHKRSLSRRRRRSRVSTAVACSGSLGERSGNTMTTAQEMCVRIFCIGCQLTRVPPDYYGKVLVRRTNTSWSFFTSVSKNCSA